MKRPEEVAAYIGVAGSLLGSPLHAAVNGWTIPASREYLALLDLIDVTGASNSSKRKPWKSMKRPWDGKRDRLGQTALPREEAIAMLEKAAGRRLPR